MNKKLVPVFERPFDIEAIIKNLRASKSNISTGYRPTFEILQNYWTSGVIDFIDCELLKYNNETRANIRFLTPDSYPRSIWVGRKMVFYEGKKITGYAIVTQIFNKILETNIP